MKSATLIFNHPSILLNQKIRYGDGWIRDPWKHGLECYPPFEEVGDKKCFVLDKVTTVGLDNLICNTFKIMSNQLDKVAGARRVHNLKKQITTSRNSGRH